MSEPASDYYLYHHAPLLVLVVPASVERVKAIYAARGWGFTGQRVVPSLTGKADGVLLTFRFGVMEAG